MEDTNVCTYPKKKHRKSAEEVSVSKRQKLAKLKSEMEIIQNMNEKENVSLESKSHSNKKSKKKQKAKIVNKTSNVNVIVQDSLLKALMQRTKENSDNVEEKEPKKKKKKKYLEEDSMEIEEEPRPPLRGNPLSSPSFAYSPTYTTSPTLTKSLPPPTNNYSRLLSIFQNEEAPPVSEKEELLEEIVEETKESEVFIPCLFCDKQYSTESKFTNHIIKKHAREKARNMKCPICSLKSTNDKNHIFRDLLYHLKARHTVDMPFPSPSQPIIQQPPTLPKPPSLAPPVIFRPADVITRTPRNVFLNGMGISRGFEKGKDMSDVLWDYVSALDASFVTDQPSPPCERCLRAVEPHHTRAILNCGHTFHSECISNDAMPSCPLCDVKPTKPKKKAKSRKRQTKVTNMEE